MDFCPCEVLGTYEGVNIYAFCADSENVASNLNVF